MIKVVLDMVATRCRFLFRRLRAESPALSLAIVSMGLAAAVHAEPPSDPVLRIEAGWHGGNILALSIAPDGKILATGSYDRTVRLWSLPDLTPIRVFRMPIGPTIEGAIYAAAFTPDGQRLAVAGWTGGWGSDKGPWCIYIVSIVRGEFERSICDLPHRANHLVYSPNGKHLAVALKKPAGIRVYRTDDYTVHARDADYSETSTFVAFDATGRLYSTSYDGKIRAYSADFRLLRSQAMPERRRPDSISVSPDGTQIAVAYDPPNDTDPLLPPAVDVLSAEDLSVRFRAETRGMDNGALTRVVWSSDGRSLYAGGTWRRGERHYLRRWGTAGRGAPKDIAVAAGNIVRLQSLPSGGLIAATDDPALIAFGADERITASHQAPMARFGDIGDRLAISRDGLTLQFAMEPGGAKPAFFSFLKRSIELGEAGPDKMVVPRTEAPELDIRNWSLGNRPTLNGENLPMQAYDRSQALAIAPDSETFVLASKWKLYHYDKKGRLNWQTEVPDGAHGAVITADNRFVIAALGDGSIRWFTADKGGEALAFYPEPGTMRWVAWTPSGYYMSSIGGDDLVEWIVNRGRQQTADHFSVGRFKGTFYRPDIILKTIAQLSEPARRAELPVANGQSKPTVFAMLPPVIDTVGANETLEVSTTKLQLPYRLRAPSKEPVEEILVRNDGLVLGTFQAPNLDGTTDEVTGILDITIPARDSNLLLFARNRFAISEPLQVKLKWVGSQATIGGEQRRLFVLAVGVNDYDEDTLKLRFASKDASDFSTAVDEQSGRAFSTVTARVPKDATLEELRKGFTWLANEVGPDDVGVIFLAGHGVDLDGAYHYLPRDARLDKLARTTLPYRELIQLVRQIKGRTLVFIDTCHAGDAFGRPGEPAIDTIGLVNQLSEPSNGVIVFAAAAGDQPSWESQSWRNGAFTKALVEGLRGEGDIRTGRRSYVTASMLQSFVKERVRDLTGGKQTPAVGMPLSVPDMLMARFPQ